jgi:hypothetical protein
LAQADNLGRHVGTEIEVVHLRIKRSSNMVQETAIPKKASPNWPTISRDKKGCVEVKGVAFIRDKRYGMPYKATPDKPDAGANGNRLARLGRDSGTFGHFWVQDGVGRARIQLRKDHCF